jgi:peptidoglycan/LPS O-acetylase OafA/YrhL
LRAGQSIERSSDGGQTWQPDFNLGGEEARIRVLDDTFYWPLGPFDAVVQRSSGNVVVAMGREGVLVRTATGVWQWASVGPYAVTELNRVDRVVALLSDEIRLALVFGLLTFVTIIRDRREARWSGLFLALAWIMSVALCFILKPGYQSWRPYLIGVISPTTYIIGAVMLLMAAQQVRRAWRDRRRAMAVAALIGLAAVIGFALPFILWTQGVMPFYRTATLLALVLLLTLTLTGRRYLQCESTVAQTAAV